MTQSPQESPGEAQRHQESPGGASRPQGNSGEPIRAQEKPKRTQERPGQPSRTHERLRIDQESPGEPRRVLPISRVFLFLNVAVTMDARPIKLKFFGFLTEADKGRLYCASRRRRWNIIVHPPPPTHDERVRSPEGSRGPEHPEESADPKQADG